MKKGLSRRNLFKYMATSGAAVAVASCQKKPEKIIPLLVPPDGMDYTPHSAFHYMTTCQECESACGMMVTAREGRAQKAEGNPFHPFNKGALCAKGQASMQALYHPNRLAFPQAKGQKLAWSDAEAQLAGKLKEAQGAVVYLTKPPMGTETRFIDEWLAAIGGGKRVSFSLFSYAAWRKANEIAFQVSEQAVYEIDKAKYLLNFSADFLETFGGIVENSAKLAEMHAYNPQEKRKNKFVHVSPHVSLTGSNADEWVMIKPGTEGLVALAMASEIQKANGSFSFLKDFLAAYAPESVAEKTGVSAEKIKTLAKEFVANSPSLALGGGNLVASDQGTETLVAINILNAVAGNVGNTVTFLQRQQPSEEVSHQAIAQLIDDLNADKVKVLIVDDVNPVYALPKSAKFAEAMKKAFVVSLASTADETSAEADLILPSLTAYESWGDATPRPGVRTIIQPVMAPVNMFEAKATEDILLSVNAALNTGHFAEIKTYRDYLMNAWRDAQKQLGNAEPFEDFWIGALEKGGIFTEAPVLQVDLSPKVTELKPAAATIEGEGLVLLPSGSLLKGDGSGANKPWLQETPDPMTQIVWDSWAEINPDTAQKLGIKDRDVIEVSTSQGKAKLTAYYQFGIHRDAIAIPMGQGHTKSGPVADGYGVNVLDLLPMKLDKQSGEFTWVGLRAKVTATTEKSYTANLDGSPRQAGRGIAATVMLNELQHGVKEHHPLPEKALYNRPVVAKEFYPDRKETAGYYKPYRWGMTIDLDRCNGCSACVVACYAENNIPVVGKERSALGREMSWIRLERYIEGFGDNFEVRMIPMTCQQCSNAGCETVCPVYATYHTPEGLNAQVYNRCVGTRYCSNNCMYKVRRFNWFDYEFPAPLDQQLNSTITTRAMGVMEKCTFCVQRIRVAQDDAMKLGRDVQDGEVVTACQQTCPTKAITFGNLEDKNSKVSQLAMRDQLEKRDRQYEVLAEVNYKPAITYLKKVTLRETPAFLEKEGHGEAAHAEKAHG